MNVSHCEHDADIPCHTVGCLVERPTPPRGLMPDPYRFRAKVAANAMVESAHPTALCRLATTPINDAIASFISHYPEPEQLEVIKLYRQRLRAHYARCLRPECCNGNARIGAL